MSYLHYFTNRYRNRVSRKRDFFNLYKIFVIQNKQKAIRFSFQNLTALLSCCVPKSSIFTCNICTKSRGLFSGYFSAAYAFRTLILLTFGRSFQRVPWQMKSTLIIVLFLLDLPRNALFCKEFRGFVKCVFFLASWQNGASCYGLLVVKLVVKWHWVTTKSIHRICSY